MVNTILFIYLLLIRLLFINSVLCSATQALRKRGARPSLTADLLHCHIRSTVVLLLVASPSSLCSAASPHPPSLSLAPSLSSSSSFCHFLSTAVFCRCTTSVVISSSSLHQRRRLRPVATGAAIVSCMVEYSNINLEEDVGSNDLCCFAYLRMYSAFGSPGVSLQRRTSPGLRLALVAL